MGQIFAFFRSIGQRCGSPSNRPETESINMVTVDSTLRDTNVSPIAASTADPVFMEMETVFDHEVEDLLQTDPGNTDTAGDLKLLDSQVEDLAQIIVYRHMVTVAIKYLGIPHETIENLKLIRQGDYIGLNRDLLVLWRNKNPGINQAQVSKSLGDRKKRCH